MMKGDVFGAKCHGLGSWFVCRNGKAVSVAHDEEILKTIWQLNYPELFGNPNRNLTRLPVFHKFSIKTKRVSNLVQGYCTKKYGMKNWIQYGKAGNFGFLSPTKPVITSKKIVPEVSYEPQEASDISDILLEDVAYGWGMSMDKKYDYDNMSRWQWLGEEVRTVEAVARTQDLLYDENALLEEDISVGVKHD